MTTIASQTIGTFLDDLGSSASVPGGGSASALAGAIAANLISMVAELSVGRPKYEPYAATIEFARAEGKRLGAVMTDLADADAAAFALYMAASTMPRATDEEIAARKAALAAAAADAIEPPRAMVAACLQIATAAERLAGRSNPGLASDLVVASRLAEGAAHGAAANVSVNLPALGDPARAAALETETARIVGAVVERAAAARAVIQAKTLRDPEPEAPGHGAPGRGVPTGGAR
jgi:methenyltetrahydrofolate cyclohydrolase